MTYLVRLIRNERFSHCILNTITTIRCLSLCRHTTLEYFSKVDPTNKNLSPVKYSPQHIKVNTSCTMFWNLGSPVLDYPPVAVGPARYCGTGTRAMLQTPRVSVEPDWTGTRTLLLVPRVAVDPEPARCCGTRGCTPSSSNRTPFGPPLMGVSLYVVLLISKAQLLLYCIIMYLVICWYTYCTVPVYLFIMYLVICWYTYCTVPVHLLYRLCWHTYCPVPVYLSYRPPLGYWTTQSICSPINI
jgi:hypothetical protein